MVKYLTFTSQFIEMKLKGFGEFIGESMRFATRKELINIKDMQFKSRLPFDLENITSWESIVYNGIRIFDYFLYDVLPEELRSQTKGWIVDESIEEFTIGEMQISMFSLYFMIMTRNKFELSTNETLPKFLTSFCSLNMDIIRMKGILTSNDLNKMDHTWIKEVDIYTLGGAVQQRFMNGIAGTRILNIFKNYVPDLILTDELKNIHKLLYDTAIEGPFVENHPLFLPTNLSASSFSKNMTNLILKLYSENVINKMVQSKSLFCFPVLDLKYTQYLTWNKDVFSGFKTKLFRTENKE